MDAWNDGDGDGSDGGDGGSDSDDDDGGGGDDDDDDDDDASRGAVWGEPLRVLRGAWVVGLTPMTVLRSCVAPRPPIELPWAKANSTRANG